MFLKCLSVILTLEYVVGAQVRVDPLVLINQGLVRGEKAVNGDYSSFHGIPYAQVDAANPFGASLPAPIFADVFNANRHGIKCPQITDKEKNKDQVISGSLDCLTLNVFVPSKASVKNPLPVLVYIHGGSYINGDSANDLVNGHKLVEQGIVVVSINYRLGPYGFFCLDVPTVPGNQGLKDQYSALKWVRDNIVHFGGNPYNVTLAGESAGAASVLYQLYAKKEKLFHKVIVESGLPQTPGLHVEGDTEAAIKVAGYLGLNTTDTEQALEFLTKSSTDLVIAAVNDLSMRLVPCVERSFSGVQNFIEADPFSIEPSNKIKNMEILIGVTSCEWCDITDRDPSVIESYLTVAFDFDNVNLNKATEAVKHFYLGDKDASEDTGLLLDAFSSDYLFIYPTEIAVAKLLKEKAGPIYSYMFNYVSENDGALVDHAKHASELKYAYANGYEQFNDDEKLVSDRLSQLWANFIKYGNPTPTKTDLVPLIWEPVSETSRPYLKIDLDLAIEHRFRQESVVFWELFYDNFRQSHRFTRQCSLE
uniref:Carboxylic ester hydrolase n=1 Tax=Plutella xylostella TaxID=51655 RepID=A0A1L8D6M4_PLUXY